MSEIRHPTTRRGFIAALGFGGVSLYALWAAYGAAPGPLALFGRSAPAAPDDHGAGSHAHDGTSGGPGADEFRRVRRQGFWDNRRRELTEALVHQVCHIRPLHLDEASGAV